MQVPVFGALRLAAAGTLRWLTEASGVAGRFSRPTCSNCPEFDNLRVNVPLLFLESEDGGIDDFWSESSAMSAFDFTAPHSPAQQACTWEWLPAERARLSGSTPFEAADQSCKRSFGRPRYCSRKASCFRQASNR